MRAASHVSHLVILAPAARRREAWRALLSGQPDIRIAGAIADPSEAAGMLQPGRPTTVLIDLPSPDPDVVRRLRSAASDCGLLFSVPSCDLAEIIPLLQAGATGCVSRDDSVGDLARAVIAAGRGEIVLPPAIATRALAALARGGQLGTSPTAARGRGGGVDRAALRTGGRGPAHAGPGPDEQGHRADADPERPDGGSAPARHLWQAGRALPHRGGPVGGE